MNSNRTKRVARLRSLLRAKRDAESLAQISAQKKRDAQRLHRNASRRRAIETLRTLREDVDCIVRYRGSVTPPNGNTLRDALNQIAQHTMKGFAMHQGREAIAHIDATIEAINANIAADIAA